MRPTITLARKTEGPQFISRMRGMTRMAAYVGIPESSASDRQRVVSDVADRLIEEALQRAKAKKGKMSKKKRDRIVRLGAIAEHMVTNAQLLWIQSKGSEIRNIPARAVLEPAVKNDSGAINAELVQASRAMLSGDREKALHFLERAGMAGRNAARRWFFDPRNGWPALSQRTIDRKHSDQPLIDTGAMRNAITSVVKPE